MITNCKNCGAPLHGSKCDYCGTEYEEHITSIRVETYRSNTHTLCAALRIPGELAYQHNVEDLSDYIKSKLSSSIAKELIPYMNIDTWFDPETFEHCIGARVRVLDPSEV